MLQVHGPNTFRKPLGITGVQESDGICMTSFSHLDLSRDVVRCRGYSIGVGSPPLPFQCFRTILGNLKQSAGRITFQELHIPEDIQKHYFDVLAQLFNAFYVEWMFHSFSFHQIEWCKDTRPPEHPTRFAVSESRPAFAWNTGSETKQRFFLPKPCHCPLQMALGCTNIYNI